MTPEILTFGEIIWDVYPDKKYIGGAGLNFAAHCAKCGAESYLFSAVGKDTLGEAVPDIAHSFGVQTELIKALDKPTGTSVVTLDENGIPTYDLKTDVAYDNIEIDDDDLSRIRELKPDALCFGTLIQRSEISRASLRRLCREISFGEIICDVNLRENCYDKDSVKLCLENATILKISDEEEPTLRKFGYYTPKNDTPEEIASAVCESFPQIKYLIITLGGKGAFVYCASEKRSFYKPSRKVTVESTVGAGDSFIAAWASAFLSGSTPEKATKRAVNLSGYVVSRSAAIPDYTFEGDTLYER